MTESPYPVFALYASMSAAIGVLDVEADKLKGNKAELAKALRLHRETMTLMRQLDTLIESELIECGVAFGGEEIEGVGRVLIHKAGKKVRYDNPLITGQLASVLSDRANMVDENGEIPPPAVITQNAVIMALDIAGTDTMSFSGWRKTKAKALGIDVDKYSSVEGGRLAIRFE